MRGVVVLQARTSSKRLPAKVLLPVAGIPLVVLAAKRAANSGRSVIVAISSDASDDELARTLDRHEIRVHRGSLLDPLSRLVGALAGFADDAPVVRLTADNVFPDGKLIDEIEHEFTAGSLEYVATNGEDSGLPYGVSVEITRVGHLREAEANATDPYDREHVTPYVIRKFGHSVFRGYTELRMAHFRCTVDLFEDYLNVCHVFSQVGDPIHATVTDLVTRLHHNEFQPVGHRAVPELVLGTAQLGADYGIANRSGQPTEVQATQMIKTAITNGVRYLDTARAYGASESVIGASLSGGWSDRVRIITKLSPLANCSQDAPGSLVRALTEASVFESCMRLGRSRLDVLMLHRANHMVDWNGQVLEHLMQLQANGLIGQIGVSVQTPEELDLALRAEPITFVQMPFNVLDHRWDDCSGLVQTAKRKRDLTLHVRSTLLQGLLTTPDAALWRRAHVADSRVVDDWLRDWASATGSLDVADFCLRYVRSQPWIDGIVLGMETIEQLRKNIAYFMRPMIPRDRLRDIEKTRPHLREDSLDPSRWVERAE